MDSKGGCADYASAIKLRMGRTSKRSSAFVKPRFAPWLAGALGASRITVSDLGRTLARGPNRNQDQANAVRSYLTGKAAPTPERAFQIGQALVAHVQGFGAVSIGGLVATHAAGYFRESLALLLALIDQSDVEAKSYAARFAACCWLAHSDLDGLELVGAADRDRLLYEYLGAAPVKSLQAAWDRLGRGEFNPADRALLTLVESAIPQEPKPDLPDDLAAWFDSIVSGVLVAWSAVHERIAQMALADPVLEERWRYGQTGFADYKDAFHNRLSQRAFVSFHRHAKEVVHPRTARDLAALRKSQSRKPADCDSARTPEEIHHFERFVASLPESDEIPPEYRLNIREFKESKESNE